MEKPFRNREEVIVEIQRCDMVSSIITYVSLIFAALGVISDALNTTLIIQPISWFLLSVITGLNALLPHLHVLVAKHLLGIQTEE